MGSCSGTKVVPNGVFCILFGQVMIIALVENCDLS